MGSVKSKALKAWERIQPEQCTAIYRQKMKVLKKFDRVIRVLNMSHQHASDFYMLFVEIDVDFSGDVDIWEFADYYELTLSLFIERLFKKLDNHDKEGLFFGEYLFSIWNLCTLTPKELVLFVFILYDEAGTGLLPHSQMRKVVEEMYELDMRVDERVPGFLLHNIDLLYNHKAMRGQAPFLTVEQFSKFAAKYTEFMAPAFSLQREVEQRSLTPDFWWQMKRLRKEMNIIMEPHSFNLYLKDISDLGNEKNVYRPGGDDDSDLEEDDSDDDDDDSSGSGSGSDDDKDDAPDIQIKRIPRREARKAALHSDPLWERTIRGVRETKVDDGGNNGDDDDDDDDDDDGSGSDSDGDSGKGDGGGSGPAVDTASEGGDDVLALGDGSASPTNGVTSPSGVGPLFEPGSATSPKGLSKPLIAKQGPPPGRRLGRRKIKIHADPKWEPRRVAAS